MQGIKLIIGAKYFGIFAFAILYFINGGEFVNMH
jgi:hypothetical protein